MPVTAPTAKRSEPETTCKKQRQKESQKDTTVEAEHRPKESKVLKATTPESIKPRSTAERPSVPRATIPLPTHLQSSLRPHSSTCQTEKASLSKDTKAPAATTSLPAKPRSALKQPKKVSFSKDTKLPAATTPPIAKPGSALKSPSSTYQPKKVSFSQDTKPPAVTAPLIAKPGSALETPSSVKRRVRNTVRFEMDDSDWSEWSDGSSCISYTDPQLPEPSINDILRYTSGSEEVTTHNRYNIDANSRARRVARNLHQSWEDSGSSTNFPLHSPADRYPSQQLDHDSQIESGIDFDHEALFSLTSSQTTSPDSEKSREKSLGRRSTFDTFEDTTSDGLDMDDIVQRVAREYPSIFDSDEDDEDPLIIWRPKEKVLFNGEEPILLIQKNSGKSNGKSWIILEEELQRPSPTHRTSRSSTSAPNTLNTTQQDWSSSAIRARREQTQRSPAAVLAPAIQDEAAPRTHSLRSMQGPFPGTRTAEHIAREQGWTAHSTRSQVSGHKPPSIEDVPEEPVEQTGIRW